MFPEISSGPILHYFSSIPIQQWLGLLAGPILFLLGPKIREYLPSFGVGKLLLSANLDRKQSFFAHVFFRSQYTLVPLLAGIASLVNHHPFVGFVFLSVGVPGTIRLLWKQNQLRKEIKFFENCFKVNNIKYTYDRVVAIEKREGKVCLKTTKGDVVLAPEEYDLIQQAFWKHGFGEDPTQAKSLDLK